MAYKEYTFAFYFPLIPVPEELRNIVITGWGGTIGTAFKRAWEKIKANPTYKGRKDLTTFQLNVTQGKTNGV